MHNGSIGGYEHIRRELDLLIDPGFYAHRRGTTDSEAMFYLALTLGLESDVPGALGRMVAAIENLLKEKSVADPLMVSLVVSDSRRLWALRYASNDAPPTMYLGRESAAMQYAGLTGGGEGDVLVMSEPLDDVGDNWQLVEPSSLVTVDRGEISAAAFAPAA